MKSIKGIIFDIDGVLEYQGRVFPGAIETLENLRAREMALRFLTNSTLKSRASAAEKLRRKGFLVSEAEVITASYATADYLKSLNPKSIWVMLDREGLDEFREFIQNEDDPEYIVVGDYRSHFDFDHLKSRFAIARQRGSPDWDAKRTHGRQFWRIGIERGLVGRYVGACQWCSGRIYRQTIPPCLPVVAALAWIGAG